MKRRLHSSTLLLAFLTSLVLAMMIEITNWRPLYFLIIILTLGLTYYKKLNFKLILIIIIGLIIGFIRVQPFRFDKQWLDQHYNQQVTLTAQLNDDLSQTRTGMKVLRLNNLKFQNRKINGKILAYSRQTLNLKRGAMIEVTGKLEPSVIGYQAQIKSAKVKIIDHNPSKVNQIRDYAMTQLKTYLPEPNHQLAAAFLLGKRRILPRRLIEQIQIVGLAHIVVASGFHLGVIVRLIKRLLAKKSRKLAFWTATFGLISFVLIAGLSASILRAIIVVGISLLVWFYGRQIRPWRLFSLAILTTVILNPLYLYSDIAWLLSFSAFFGILIFGPTARRFFFGPKKLNFITQIMTEAIAAQICTMPITMLFFGKLSLIAPLTNLLVLPIVPIIMSLSFILIIIAPLTPLVQIISWPLNRLLDLIVWLIDKAAKLPLANINTNIDIYLSLIIGLIILVWTGYMYWQNYRLKQSNYFNLID